MIDVGTAERLWASAHAHVERGALELAVHDLARCFEILQALGDARAYAVHKRWSEVQRLYLEGGARALQGGDVVAAPVSEASLLHSSVSAPPTLVPAPDVAHGADVAPPADRAPAAAPAMHVDDAPIGMQSLDVPFSVGEVIDSWQADELPVRTGGLARAGDARAQMFDEVGPPEAARAVVALADAAPVDARVADEALDHQALADAAPAEVALADAALTGSALTDAAPAEVALSEVALSEVALPEEAQVEEAQVEEAQVEEAQVEEAQVEGAQADEPQADDALTTAAPVDEAPAHVAPGDVAPVNNAPVDDAAPGARLDAAPVLGIAGSDDVGGLPTDVTEPASAITPLGADVLARVAFLEELLARVQERRRLVQP